MSINATIHNGILLNTVTEVSPHDPNVWWAVWTGVILESKTSRTQICTDSHLQSILLFDDTTVSIQLKTKSSVSGSVWAGVRMLVCLDYNSWLLPKYYHTSFGQLPLSRQKAQHNLWVVRYIHTSNHEILLSGPNADVMNILAIIHSAISLHQGHYNVWKIQYVTFYLTIWCQRYAFFLASNLFICMPDV